MSQRSPVSHAHYSCLQLSLLTSITHSSYISIALQSTAPKRDRINFLDDTKLIRVSDGLSGQMTLS